MKKVLVLLSTYNGEKYLVEQVESIIRQVGVTVSILIRDDGSKDNTRKVVMDLASVYNNIEYIFERNIGYEKSFMELVYRSGEFDFYAFADQDDVWLENKLQRAIEKLENVNGIGLYYSMMTQVNNDLEVLKEQQTFKYPIDKPEVLFQNFVQGSTIVFNKATCDLIKEYKLKDKIAHDIWIPCVITYFGKVVFDEESYILYRKHDQAVTAIKEKYWRRLLNRISKGEIVPNLAKCLFEGYVDKLNEEDRAFVEYVATYRKSFTKRMRLVFSNSVRKKTFKGTLLLKLSFLFGRVQ